MGKMGKKINAVRLENWSLVEDTQNPFLAPELRRAGLHGQVFGHPCHEDGKVVTTSPPVAKTSMDGGTAKIVTRSGTVYKLGAVDPAYAKTSRGARRRLIASLPLKT